MTTYNIRYTDKTKPAIPIEENTRDTTTTDVELYGRIELEYGEGLNENMLHLLENFACPEDNASTLANVFPDYTINEDSLRHPTNGQLWYNSTQKRPFSWNGTKWVGVRLDSDVAGNWGQILDGNQLPRPINRHTGYVYQYNECIWAVSPASLPQAFTYMVCTTDSSGLVNMKYRNYGDNNLSSGIANYMIISIVGNVNNGDVSITPEPPGITPTPTGTPPPSVTPTSSLPPGITPTPTPAPAPTNSPTKTLPPGVTPTPTNSPSPTPGPSPTPAATVTPAATITPTPTITVTPTTTPFVNTCGQCQTMGFDCCVARNSFLPMGGIAGDIMVSDIMMLADSKTLEPATGIVSYSNPSLQDCVRIVTEIGASLVCSITAPIATTDGLIKAPELLDHNVAVNINGESSWSKVISVTHIGKEWVQNITVGDRCFWAGEASNAFILHHNAKFCDNCDWVQPNCCECAGEGP